MEKSTHSPLYRAFCRQLIALRQNAGMSQREFAKVIKRDHQFVHRIESGDRRLDMLEFYWLCQALGHDPMEIVQKVYADFDRMSLRKSRRRHS